MSYRIRALSGAFVLFAGAASAQQFGGELGLSYALPTDSGDLSITEYYGALEYNIGRSFSIGADLAGYSFEDIDDSYLSSTLHLTYHLNEFSSVGIFTGRDVVTDDITDATATSNLNGIEAGAAYNQFEVEGYIMFVTGGSNEPTVFGADVLYHFNDQIGAFAEVDFSNGDDLDFNRVAIGGTYEINRGPELYGQIGQRSSTIAGSDDSSTFVELGASIKFGTNRGTTFDSRSLFELFPNY